MMPNLKHLAITDRQGVLLEGDYRTVAVEILDFQIIAHHLNIPRKEACMQFFRSCVRLEDVCFTRTFVGRNDIEEPEVFFVQRGGDEPELAGFCHLVRRGNRLRPVAELNASGAVWQDGFLKPYTAGLDQMPRLEVEDSLIAAEDWDQLVV